MNPLTAIRQQFPITRQCFTGPDGVERPIIYLDHGASTHPPLPVLDAYREFLERYYANIHRGNHFLSQKASDLFDAVSETVFRFVGADPRENGVVYTSNTTTALDIASYLMADVEGATLVSGMEHHSNDLPHRRRGETLRIGVLEDGTLDYEDLERKLSTNRVKLVALTGASNVTGYMPRIHDVARMAHRYGARLLLDAAQLLAHHPIDMRPNSADDHIDFLAAAGHKAYAPFGSAFLIAPNEVLNSCKPYIPGGGTVRFVTENNTLWHDDAERHNGGTPNIAGVIALGAALDWLSEIGMEWVREHELELLEEVESRLRAIEGVVMLGNVPVDRKLGVLSFNIDGLYHETVSMHLNSDYGIATRNGCFCAHPYLSRLLRIPNAEDVLVRIAAGEDIAMPGAVRATIGIYNNRSDLDLLLNAVTDLAARSRRGERFQGEPTGASCAEVA